MTLNRRRFAWLPGFSALLIVFLLAACGEANTQNPTPTPSQTSSTTIDLGIPGTALDSPVVGPVPDDTLMHVTITFKVNQDTLNQLGTPTTQTGDLASQASNIGITDEQYAQIKAYLGIEDAKLNLGKLHTDLTVDAKASTFANLLHTSFQYHEYNGKKFYAPTSAIQIPANIGNFVLGISGLESYSQDQQPGAASQYAQMQQNKAQDVCQTDQPGLHFPKDVSNTYGIEGMRKEGWTGKGVTIILPEFAPLRQDDVNTYLSCVGYRGKLSVVTVNDTLPDASIKDGEFEVALDVEMIAGLAPDADIVIYQTNGQNVKADGTKTFAFHDVLHQIIEDNTDHTDTKIVSLSWGIPEPLASKNSANILAQDIQILTQAEHMSVFVASGDCGAYTTQDYPNTLAIGEPASAPWSIAVGGTQLKVDDNSTRSEETAWSQAPTDPHTCDNSWGSTGGNSMYFQKPVWQDAPGVENSYSNGSRQVPDVAAVSLDIAVYFDGQWMWGRGTSAAAPIWAAGMADLLHKLAYTTQHYWFGPEALYSAHKDAGNLHPFYDIQQGDNLYYKAGSGWDYTTGMGVPNFADLYQVQFQRMQAILKQ